MKNIIKSQVGAILNEPEVIGTVIVPYDNLWDNFLKQMGWKPPREEELILTGATASTNFKISSLIEDLLTESDRSTPDARMWHLMNANILTVVEILAVALHNKPGDPPSWLKVGLENYFSQEQLREIMSKVYGRLGVEDFFGTLDLVRSLTMQESDTRETTASTQSLEE